MARATGKAIQAVCLFGVPLIWDAWQVYVLNHYDVKKHPPDGT